MGWRFFFSKMRKGDGVVRWNNYEGRRGGNVGLIGNNGERRDL
jgi:hypothetical protein